MKNIFNRKSVRQYTQEPVSDADVQTLLKHANMAILVCGDTVQPDDGKYNLNWEHDCSAAAQNILLAAESLGLGAVWSATYPNEDRILLVKSLHHGRRRKDKASDRG